MSKISKFTTADIKNAASLLKDGNLVAFPTETVYGLGGDAENKDAVARIYKVKGRPVDHPLIIHISSARYINKWARDFPEYVLGLASAFWPGPMTLILPRTSTAKDFITGGQDSVAIRVPSHVIAQALLKEFENRGGIGIAAPSANRFGAVSPTTADAVSSELGQYLTSNDLILDGGQCVIGIESTIIDCRQSLPIIRRPGKVTQEMIEELLNIKIDLDDSVDKIKAPGLYESHYAPKAKIFLTGLPKMGDGYIALSHLPTPEGAVRLASPNNNEEYAQILYMALRSADSKGIENVVVIPPIGKGVAIAVNDRLKKAAFLQ